ncbi:MAG: acyl-CoA dehydrogenase family protein, partial [Alphaproteobacteria bacterium]
AWARATAAPDYPLAAAAARASATEAYLVAARESLHVHGGIGFTWDADCHLFYRRARALAAVFGSAAQWRECLAERIARGERAMK